LHRWWGSVAIRRPALGFGLKMAGNLVELEQRAVDAPW
jgi:hypothetical protein